MYIKIKNPQRSSLLVQIIALAVVFATILSILLVFIFVTRDIHLVWEQMIKFFQYSKQEQGSLISWGAVIIICAIPIFLLKEIWDWFQKRKQWAGPTAIRVLDFEPEGISLITYQSKYFLPYRETKLAVDSQIITIRTKNSSYPAITAITFCFKQGDTTFTVDHKPANDTLYQIMDFYPRFQKLTFHFTLSSPSNLAQQELAHFVQEQLENHRRYGFHVRYKEHLTITLFALLFCALPFVPALAVGGLLFDFHSIFFWIVAVLLLSMLTGGLTMLYGIYKDLKVKHKLNQLHSQNR